MDKIVFKAKVKKLAQKLNVTPREIHMRDMSNKWASCSTKGRLTFDYEILDLEERVQRYVVVHELLHLRFNNHGKLFKSILRQYCPEYLRIEGKLNVISKCSKA